MLDYRVFGHNFIKFPEALDAFEKKYEQYRAISKEEPKNRDLIGHGMYFKHRRLKLNRWYQNYRQIWGQFFSII